MHFTDGALERLNRGYDAVPCWWTCSLEATISSGGGTVSDVLLILCLHLYRSFNIGYIPQQRKSFEAFQIQLKSLFVSDFLIWIWGAVRNHSPQGFLGIRKTDERDAIFMQIFNDSPLGDENGWIDGHIRIIVEITRGRGFNPNS